MKIRFALVCLALVLLSGCIFPVDPDPLTQKPSILGLGVSISDIPLQHDVQPRLLVE